MANPTTLSTNPAVLVASTSEFTLTIDGERAYTFAHDSEDSSGDTDSNTIYLAINAAVTADPTEGNNKIKLINGRSVVIGPGVTRVRFKCASGGPTMTVMPDVHALGAF